MCSFLEKSFNSICIFSLLVILLHNSEIKRLNIRLNLMLISFLILETLKPETVWTPACPIKSIICNRLKPKTDSLTLGPLFVSPPQIIVQNHILYVSQQLYLLKEHGSRHAVRKYSVYGVWWVLH